MFNEEVGEESMYSFHNGGTVTVHHRDLIKSVDVLINVLLYDNLGRRLRKPVIHPFRGRIGEYALEYFEFLMRKGVSQAKTIQAYKKSSVTLLSIFSLKASLMLATLMRKYLPVTSRAVNTGKGSI